MTTANMSISAMAKMLLEKDKDDCKFEAKWDDDGEGSISLNSDEAVETEKPQKSPRKVPRRGVGRSLSSDGVGLPSVRRAHSSDALDPYEMDEAMFDSMNRSVGNLRGGRKPARRKKPVLRPSASSNDATLRRTADREPRRPERKKRPEPRRIRRPKTDTAGEIEHMRRRSMSGDLETERRRSSFSVEAESEKRSTSTSDELGSEEIPNAELKQQLEEAEATILKLREEVERKELMEMEMLDLRRELERTQKDLREAQAKNKQADVDDAYGNSMLEMQVLELQRELDQTRSELRKVKSQNTEVETQAELKRITAERNKMVQENHELKAVLDLACPTCRSLVPGNEEASLPEGHQRSISKAQSLNAVGAASLAQAASQRQQLENISLKSQLSEEPHRGVRRDNSWNVMKLMSANSRDSTDHSLTSRSLHGSACSSSRGLDAGSLGGMESWTKRSFSNLMGSLHNEADGATPAGNLLPEDPEESDEDSDEECFSTDVRLGGPISFDNVIDEKKQEPNEEHSKHKEGEENQRGTGWKWGLKGVANIKGVANMIGDVVGNLETEAG